MQQSERRVSFLAGVDGSSGPWDTESFELFEGARCEFFSLRSRSSVPRYRSFPHAPLTTRATVRERVVSPSVALPAAAVEEAARAAVQQVTAAAAPETMRDRATEEAAEGPAAGARAERVSSAADRKRVRSVRRTAPAFSAVSIAGDRGVQARGVVPAVARAARKSVKAAASSGPAASAVRALASVR